MYEFESRKLLLYLIQPVRWLYNGDFAEAGAANVRDGRILLAFIGIFAFGVTALFRGVKHINRRYLFLALFFTIDWIVFACMFRRYRFIVGLELISGALFIAGLIEARFFSTKLTVKTWGVLAAIAVFLASTTVYPNWGRRNWQHRFVKATFPYELSSKDTVFIADTRLSFLVPELIKHGVTVACFYSQPWVLTGRDGYPSDPKPIYINNPNNVFFLQYSPRDLRLDSPSLSQLMEGRILTSKRVKTNWGEKPLMCKFSLPSDLPVLEQNRVYQHDDGEILFPTGWNANEPGHRWSNGHKATLQFYLPKTEVGQNGVKIRFTGDCLGEQKIGISICGHEKMDKTFTNNAEFEICIMPDEIKENGLADIQFEFPEAKSPGNGNQDLLAFALKTLKIVSP